MEDLRGIMTTVTSIYFAQRSQMVHYSKESTRIFNYNMYYRLLFNYWLNEINYTKCIIRLHLISKMCTEFIGNLKSFQCLWTWRNTEHKNSNIVSETKNKMYFFTWMPKDPNITSPRQHSVHSCTTIPKAAYVHRCKYNQT